MTEGQDLIFYDGECGLCDMVVQFVLLRDKQKRYVFAPLQGETALELLKDLPSEYKQLDSLVLVENYASKARKYYVMGRGAFRIAWNLGGLWALVGWLNFLPPVLYDWGYRWVARNRYRLFGKIFCVIPDYSQKGRFLP